MIESRIIPLATRTGREIPNIQDPPIPPFKAEMLIGKFRKEYPEAILRSRPSGQYNCHGLTFASRRTQVGISDPGIVSFILKDDGYRQIAQEKVRAGDVFLCYSGGELTHSGLVVHVDAGDQARAIFAQIFVISKWAHAGEYYHLVNQGYYGGHVKEFWSEKT